jgi:predicted transcriptional regulator
MVPPLPRLKIAQIRKLKRLGYTIERIARTLKIGTTTVSNYLKAKIKRRIHRIATKKSNATIVTKSNIQRLKLLAGKVSFHRAQDIKTRMKLHGSLRSTQRLCRSAKVLLTPPQDKPSLTPKRMETRVEWARKHLIPSFALSQVFFDDEAKFFGRAPAHYRYTYSERGKGRFETALPDYHLKVSVWGAIGLGWKSDIVFASASVNGTLYLSFIRENLVEPLKKLTRGNPILITDNAPWHTAKVVVEGLRSEGVETLPLPPYSPDINPIENLWSLIGKRIYADGKGYATAAALQTAIAEAWNSFTVPEIDKLITSLSSRLFEVVRSQGGPTKY